jgi:hypothetical protein
MWLAKTNNQEIAFECVKPKKMVSDVGGIKLVSYVPGIVTGMIYDRWIYLENGTIEKLIGKQLTAKDEAIEWK